MPLDVKSADEFSSALQRSPQVCMQAGTASSAGITQLLIVAAVLQSVVHFWASWSTPCGHMDVVLAELAKQHPTLTVIRVRVLPP
jgi:thiol-disulfide isomerase/thioredoxin